MSDAESDDAAAQGGGDGDWEDWGDAEDMTSPTRCAPPSFAQTAPCSLELQLSTRAFACRKASKRPCPRLTPPPPPCASLGRAYVGLHRFSAPCSP